MLAKVKRISKFNLNALKYKHLQYFKKHREKLGLSFIDFLKLKRYGSFNRQEMNIPLFNEQFEITSPFWFLHSLDEIFVEEVYMFRSNVEAPVIIDCGANVGLSVLYFKKLYPKANISAIEADPLICNTLKNNVRSFDLKNVNVIHSAVWYENTTLSFTSEGSVGGKIEFGDARNSTIRVPAIRLKDYLQNQVDFLKIDIEGAEYDVIKDCRELFGNVKNLFIEYHVMPGEEQLLHEILQWVKEAGFKYYIKEAWNNMSFPFMKIYDDTFQMQLNIFCYR